MPQLVLPLSFIGFINTFDCVIDLIRSSFIVIDSVIILNIEIIFTISIRQIILSSQLDLLRLLLLWLWLILIWMIFYFILKLRTIFRICTIFPILKSKAIHFAFTPLTVAIWSIFEHIFPYSLSFWFNHFTNVFITIWESEFATSILFAIFPRSFIMRIALIFWTFNIIQCSIPWLFAIFPIIIKKKKINKIFIW